MEKILCDEYYVAQTKEGNYMYYVGNDAWQLTGVESATALEFDELSIFAEHTSEENPYTDFQGQLCRLVKLRKVLEVSPVYQEER